MPYIKDSKLDGNQITIEWSDGRTSVGMTLRNYGGAYLVYFEKSHTLVHVNLRYRDAEIIAKGVTIK